MRIMKKKAFDELIYIVEVKLNEILNYFIGYNILFETKAKEMEMRSYGGYEVYKLLTDFGEELDKKTTMLLEEIQNVIVSSSRNVSSKQIVKLTDKCTQTIDIIIEQYLEKNQQLFGKNETIELSLINLKQNMEQKIKTGIKMIKAVTSIKIDKALRWTMAGTIIAALVGLVSTIISIQ